MITVQWMVALQDLPYLLQRTEQTMYLRTYVALKVNNITYFTLFKEAPSPIPFSPKVRSKLETKNFDLGCLYDALGPDLTTPTLVLEF